MGEDFRENVRIVRSTLADSSYNLQDSGRGLFEPVQSADMAGRAGERVNASSGDCKDEIP